MRHPAFGRADKQLQFSFDEPDHAGRHPPRGGGTFHQNQQMTVLPPPLPATLLSRTETDFPRMFGPDGEALRRHGDHDVPIDAADVGRDFLVGKVRTDSFAAFGKPELLWAGHECDLRIHPSIERVRSSALGAVMGHLEQIGGYVEMAAGEPGSKGAIQIAGE